MSKEVIKYLALNRDENDLMQRILTEAVNIDGMTEQEIKTLKSLRSLFHLSEVDGMDEGNANNEK